MNNRIQIVRFQSRYAERFKSLNEAWLVATIGIDDKDRKLLDDPKSEIVDKGGNVLFVLADEHVVGCCALIFHGNGKYELAKMCVDESQRGEGIGRRLGLAVIRQAMKYHADELYLDTNVAWTPAVKLYTSLGFEELTDIPGKSTCNLRMSYRGVDIRSKSDTE